MKYHYVQSEPGLYTVGYEDSKGNWHPDIDTKDRQEAAKRVAWMNGSSLVDHFGNKDEKAELNLNIVAIVDSTIISSGPGRKFSFGEPYKILDVALPGTSNDVVIRVRNDLGVAMWIPALYFKIEHKDCGPYDIRILWEYLRADFKKSKG